MVDRVICNLGRLAVPDGMPSSSLAHAAADLTWSREYRANGSTASATVRRSASGGAIARRFRIAGEENLTFSAAVVYGADRSTLVLIYGGVQYGWDRPAVGWMALLPE